MHREWFARHWHERFSECFPKKQPAGVMSRHLLSKGEQGPDKTGLRGSFPATAQTSVLLEILPCSYRWGNNLMPVHQV